jgi:DNA-binding XRE family transcriptional regulator
MAKNGKEVMKRLPVSRRKKIEARAALLIAEEMTLQEMRKARELTQEKLAKSLGVNQKQVSAIEKRTDMHLSTLRRTVEKMVGHLTIVVEFPDREPVTLAGIATAEPKPTPRHPVSVARTRPESSYFPSRM